MPAATCSDTEFIGLWAKYGSPGLIAKHLGLDTRNVLSRRRAIEGRHGVTLDTWNSMRNGRTVRHAEGRIDLDIQDGVVIVFSDAHYWPGVRTTAHRALLSLIRQLKPVSVICNGDAFDGATISRWPSISWMDKSKKPTVIEELRACQEYLGEIEDAAGTADLLWPLGNHDARYEGRLAAAAPEFENMPGFTLKEHFPRWLPCWTAWINGDVCVTHFYHQGIHDTHNNVMKGQCHYVTGHTHSLKVTPWTTAAGRTLYGVNTGTLADALGEHNVDYQRGRHGNHRSGFAVLTFKDGELLLPELVQVWDEDTVQFRGHLLDSDTGAVK